MINSCLCTFHKFTEWAFEPHLMGIQPMQKERRDCFDADIANAADVLVVRRRLQTLRPADADRRR